MSVGKTDRFCKNLLRSCDLSYELPAGKDRQLHRSERIKGAIHSALDVGMAVVVLSVAGLVGSAWFGVTHWLVWWVVGLEAVSLFLNLITQSAGERAVWGPAALLLLASSTVAALEEGSPIKRPAHRVLRRLSKLGRRFRQTRSRGPTD